MNPAAVSLGVLYGVVSAVVCYVLSQITSGLFARPFYRFYSRVLIGICSVMLVAPGLRWLAMTNPRMAAIGLTFAQYAILAILSFGVYRFNRDYMKKLFLERKATAYFSFGTLANAAFVSLAFLHFSVVGTSGWQESAYGLITAANYGPLVIIAAALLFHTDYHLKKSTGDPRLFTGVTFISYAVSFVGLALSLFPYLESVLTELQLASIEDAFLQNFYGSQALFFAILLFGWLVWRYESAPPLYLMLFAIIAEYHILVGQWATQFFGPSAWPMAALPLAIGFTALDHYFSKLDARRHRDASKDSEPAEELRFMMPFRVVGIALGLLILSVTFWTRGATVPDGSQWFGVTLTTYAIFSLVVSFVRRSPQLIYLSGALGLIAALGTAEPIASPTANFVLAVLAAGWCSAAWAGERFGLKREWKTCLTDCGFISAIVSTLVILAHHLIGPDPYRLGFVDYFDGAAAVLAAFAFSVAAYQYRSCLPVAFGMVVLAMAIPPWSASLGLAATIVGLLIERRFKAENALAYEDHCLAFGTLTLPFAERFPKLFAQPLLIGSIPLALCGLGTSVWRVAQNDLSIGVLAGASVSALVLLRMTKDLRATWLYVTGIVAGYFAIHSIAHVFFQDAASLQRVLALHILLNTTISVAAWMIATAYERYCDAMIKRVAEQDEQDYVSSRQFYCVTLFRFVIGIATPTLLTLVVMTVNNGVSVVVTATALLTMLIFAMAASRYRSTLFSYPALAALALAAIHVGLLIGLPIANTAAIFALIAAIGSCFASPNRVDETLGLEADQGPTTASKARSGRLSLSGDGLWRIPLAASAILASFAAVGTSLEVGLWSRIGISTTSAFALSGLAMILSTRALRSRLLYVLGLAVSLVSAHFVVAEILPFDLISDRSIEIHAAVNASLLLAFSLIGVLISNSIGKRLQSSSSETRARLTDLRVFYVGTLQHFCFAIALAMLSATLAAQLDSWRGPEFVSRLNLIAGLSLSVVFTLQGWVYRSRIHSYLALISAGLGTYGLTTLLAPQALIEEYRILCLAISAFAMGFASWLLSFADRNQTTSEQNLRSRGFDCWEQPPLPLVSSGWALWTGPLSHGSIVVAFFSLGIVARNWWYEWPSVGFAWHVIAAMYLSSLTLLIATSTYRLGLVGKWLLLDHTSDPADAEKGESTERGILYVLSMMTFALATHLTVESALLENLGRTEAIAWHLFTAAGLTLGAWMVATLYTVWSFAAWPSHPDGDNKEQTSVTTRRTAFYSGILHHVALSAANVVFVGCCVYFVLNASLSLPLLCSIGMIGLYFVLATATYQTRWCSTAALLCVTLGTFYLAHWYDLGWPDSRFPWLNAITVLGFSFASVAVVLGRLPGKIRLDRLAAPSPWKPTGRDVSSEHRGRDLWLFGLQNLSVGLAVASLTAISFAMVLPPANLEAGQILTALFVAGATFYAAAYLYGNAVPAYLASVVIGVCGIPLTIVLGRPESEIGILLAMIAVALWIAGFLVERAVARRRAEPEEPKALSWISIYEVPLTRMSVILAITSIAHSVGVWVDQGWEPAKLSLLATSTLAALTLSLNARSLAFMQRIEWARTLVYLACFSLTAAVTGLFWGDWQLAGVALSAAVSSLALSIVGGLLIESSKKRDPDSPGTSLRMTFGEPITNYAGLVGIFAIGVALVELSTSMVGSRSIVDLQTALAEFDPSTLLPIGLTFLIASVVWMIQGRAYGALNRIYASIVLSSVGLVFLLQSQFHFSAVGMIILTLVVMNLLSAFASFARRNNERFADLLDVSAEEVDQPFYRWPFASASVLFAVHTAVVVQQAWIGADVPALWAWVTINVLCGLVFAQTLRLGKQSIYLHFVLTAIIVGTLGSSLLSGWIVSPDVLFAVIGLICAIASGLLARGVRLEHSQAEPPPEGDDEGFATQWLLAGWATGLLVIGLATTVPASLSLSIGYPNIAACLSLTTVSAFVSGLLWRDSRAVVVAAVLFPMCFVAAALFYGRSDAIIEYGALSTALLCLVYYGVSEVNAKRQSDQSTDPFVNGCADLLRQVSQWFSFLVVALTTVSIVQAVSPILPAASLGLVILYWMSLATTSQQERFAYAALISIPVWVAFVMYTLLDLPLLGNAVAAYLLIGYGFTLYACNLIIGRHEGSVFRVFLRPTYQVALFAPLGSVLAITLEDRASAAFILMSAGAFYLTISGTSQRRWTAYVAAIFINVAVYLWIPTAREVTGLYQLYVIPSAITVLIFAQLHRHELKPQALSGIRYAASGAILAASTIEVIFSDESSLVQFVLVLGLSLIGTAVGISMRIKPFVYLGVMFLVLNVVGQIGVQFHREGGVVRAVILITVGLLILGAMIFFNIHRERILRRYRHFVLDRHWE